jgi:hypothetical protein
MTLSEFESLIDASSLNHPLAALWHDAKGDWHKAHTIAQEIQTRDGAWVHAYLHRKEGDRSNALHWYQQAGRKFSTQSLTQEWQEMVSTLLTKI